MAERLMAHALAAEKPPLRDLRVTSAGLSALPGQSASANAVAALKKVGLPLENFRSKPFDQSILDQSTVIFCMTENHRTLIDLHFNNSSTPVYLVREFVPDGDIQIPDPFGMDFRAYEAARDSIVEAIPSLLDKLRSINFSTS